MFEETTTPNEEKTRTRILILSTVILVLLATAGVLLYRAFSSHQKSPPQEGLSSALRAGAPDYDRYVMEIAISNQEFFYTTNALGGRQIIAKGRVQNFGNRRIKGLEVRAVAYDFDGKPLRERLAAPIPHATTEPLEPNGTLPILVVIDNAPDENLVQDIKLELHGLLLQ